MGGTGEDDFCQPFTSFSSFRSATTGFEYFEFSLDDSISLLLNLLCLLGMVYTMFRVRTEIYREVVQKPALGMDSPEWQGMWEKMGQFLKEYSDPIVC